MKSHYNLFAAVLLLQFSALALGEVIVITDIDQVLHAKLKAKYPNHLPKLENYTLASEGVTFGDLRTSLDKLSEAKDSLRIGNCSTVIQNHDASLSVSTRVGARVSVTHGFTSINRQSISLGLSDVKKLIGLTVSSSQDITVQTTKAGEQNFETTETKSETFRRSIPAMTLFEADMIRKRRHDEVDFTANVLVSGTAIITTVKIVSRCAGAWIGATCVGRLIDLPIIESSQIRLENELSQEDRRFAVKGIFQSITAVDTIIAFRSSEIKDLNANVCTAQQPATVARKRLATPPRVAVARSPMRTARADDGPSIGPPNGISYVVSQSNTAVRMTPACGFNDFGLPNGGSFLLEERQYSEHSDGKLLRSWSETHEIFQRCVDV